MEWIIIWLIGYLLGIVAMIGFFTALLKSHGLGWWFFFKSKKPVKR